MKAPTCILSVTYRIDTVRNDEARFQAGGEWVAANCNLEHLEVSIGIVDDPTIHALNRTHLDHDWPTDVLSFVFEHQPFRVDGEIIASADTAKRLSLRVGWSAEDELLLYVVHGLLHLAGLDDLEPADQAAMRAAERRCLMDLGVAGAKSHLERWGEFA